MTLAPDGRTRLAGGLTFLSAGVGIATLWFALDTRSWDGLEALLLPLLIGGTAIGSGWVCALGLGLVRGWTWTRAWARWTFAVVGVVSGLVLFDTVQRVADGAPVRHVAAPASLLTVAVAIVVLLAQGPDRP